MAAIDQGKRFGIKWSKNRVQKIQQLGWSDLDEGAAVDRALEHAYQYQQFKRFIDRLFNGEENFGTLLRKLKNL